MVRARRLAFTFSIAAATAAACSSSDDAGILPSEHDGGRGGGGGNPNVNAGRAGHAGSTGTAGHAGSTGTTAGTPGSSGATGGHLGSAGRGDLGTGGAPPAGGTAGGAGRLGTSNAGRGGRPSGSAGTGGVTSTAAGASDGGNSGAADDAGAANASGYDAVVLADGPVAYLVMSGTTTEPDLTGNGHDGSYRGGAPAHATLPNGDVAADFDGKKQYLTVPSAAVLSIPTTHELTWEAWIRPDVLEFTNDTNGYVDWMGKCEEYAPTCEWEARMYSMTNSENRCNRLSAYAFNPDGDLGSGAFWQQTDCGVGIVAGNWYHVVGEYTTLASFSGCSNTSSYPGSIDIWVNGVRWRQASHGDTGCMSQYQIVPVANDSPLNVGTMAHDAWFEGAVGKVAIYDKRLAESAITHHYTVMTGKQPTGSCADTCSF